MQNSLGWRPAAARPPQPSVTRKARQGENLAAIHRPRALRIRFSNAPPRTAFFLLCRLIVSLERLMCLRKLSMIPEIGTGTHLGMKAKDRKDGTREQRNADAEEHAAARKLTVFMRKTLCTKRTRRKEARIADQKHPLSSLPFAIGAQDDSTPYLYYTADIADIEGSRRGNQESEVRAPLSRSIRESDKSTTHRPI
jgi:hypothetical protein